MNVLSIRPALLASALISLIVPALPAAPQMVRVTGVVDGRTLAVTSPAGDSLVTLAGVALRSIDETAGFPSRSAEFLRASVGGRWVMIEREAAPAPPPSSPSFWVYRSPDGLDLNRELIRRGIALLTKEPCSRAGELLDAEREARGDSVGAWKESATGSFTHPMTYLGTIDPPHVRRDASGVLTTRKATAKPKSASRSPLVVVIETHPAPQ